MKSSSLRLPQGLRPGPGGIFVSRRAELELALERAELELRSAQAALEKAEAARRGAEHDWGRYVDDRRKAGPDRRKPDSSWDHSFPDRRKAQSDRRISEADISALAKAVAQRHEAYMRRSSAEADCVLAQARLNAAGREQERLRAEIDALGGARKQA